MAAHEKSAEAERRSGWRTIKKVLPYLWPRDAAGAWIRRTVIYVLILLVVSRFVNVAAPFFYGYAVDALGPDAATDTPAWANWLGLGALALTIIYGVTRIAAVGFAQLRDAIFAPVAQRALRLLALETFEHIHALSLRYHLTRKTGGLSRVIERGTKGIEFLLRFMLFSVGPLILELLLVGLVFFFVFGFWYLVVVVLTIAIYFWFTFQLTEYRVKIRRKMNEMDTDANQKAIDSLLNYETVKYFNADRREAARYDLSMQGYERAAIQTSVTLSWLNFGQTVIITLGIMLVMGFAVLGVRAGELTVGDFVMANALMIQITMPLNFLGTVYREIRQALVDMGDMFDLLEQDPEVKDVPDASEISVSRGEIRFSAVNFGYNRDRQILHGFDVAVKPGETVAIVGPSGSGKSTIGRLLFRFYDVWSGSIAIDGQDLRHVTRESLHGVIGIVPQDTVLFNDTIGYNIAYGREGASEVEVVAAAKAARIHEFIMSLPEGYQTSVGERGLKLSGGEKQRVGIARTLLKNPPILLLDEATSALDTQTEKSIQESLHAMGEGRTVLTIAHRLSTVVDADKIIVLEKGQIVEWGRHEELLAKGGKYAQMWQRQAAEAEETDAKAG